MENRKVKSKKVKVILGFRWMTVFLTFCILLPVWNEIRSPGAVVACMAGLIIYNGVMTFLTLGKSIHIPAISGWLDILLLCILMYFSTGLSSDLYLLLLFVASFCCISSKSPPPMATGIFAALAYTVFMLPGLHKLDWKQGYWKLGIRDGMLVAAVLGVTYVGLEARRYNELHKKEFMIARTDKLTGLANRHYFDQKLSREVEYADDSGNPLNVLIFDLDNFKKFNDTYGHVWGDKLLTLFSDIIRQNIRKSDIPVRYGGEEFLILIRDLDMKMAREVADRIRSQLQKEKIYITNVEGDLLVSVSCGVAQYPRNGTNIKEVIDLADKALYKAKEKGKNRVMTWDEVK